MDNSNILENYQPAQYQQSQPAETVSDTTQDPVMFRKRIKKGYGWSGLTMIFQLLFSMAVFIFAGIIYSVIEMSGFMAENPGASYEQLTEASNEMAQNVAADGRYNIAVTTVAYLIANLSAAAIGITTVKAFKTKNLFRKSKRDAKWIAIGALSALGIQAFSIFVQNMMISLTGLVGMSEEAASMANMSDDTLMNILILLYVVIIAPITEELLMRGMVMNSLAPVSRKFALIASALLFGLMHGNFNQMFNGFLLGLIFGYIALKSGSIIPSIIAHMVVNANAVLCSYVYDYKVFESSGDEMAAILEIVHFAVLLIIGIIALIFFLKKNGKIKQEDMVVPEYSYEISPTEGKKLTWSLLAKCPSVWLVTIIYILLAITSVHMV